MAKPKINWDELKKASTEATDLLKALSNSDRLILFCEISKSEKCVFELQENTNIVQPTLSQQLTVLRKSGLVKTRREGKQIYYSPSNPVAEAIIKILYKHYCD